MFQFKESWQPVIDNLVQIDITIDELLSGVKDDSTMEESKDLHEFSRVIKISLKEFKQIAQGIPFDGNQLKLLLEMADSLEEKIEINEIPGRHLLPEYRREKANTSSLIESLNCSVRLMHQIICKN